MSVSPELSPASREDIPLLAKHFILQCNQKLVRAVRDIDEQTLARFTAYDWPGNVRELQHAIEHAKETAALNSYKPYKLEVKHDW